MSGDVLQISIIMCSYCHLTHTISVTLIMESLECLSHQPKVVVRFFFSGMVMKSSGLKLISLAASLWHFFSSAYILSNLLPKSLILV